MGRERKREREGERGGGGRYILTERQQKKKIR